MGEGRKAPVQDSSRAGLLREVPSWCADTHRLRAIRTTMMLSAVAREIRQERGSR